MLVAQRSSVDAVTDAAAPLVSIVVPGRDARNDFSELCETLGRQTLDRGRFEILIADDGSTTPPVELATSDSHVRVLPGERGNPYVARNRGAAAARGSIIAFCDTDCRPEQEWLERGVAALADADIVAGLIRFELPPHLSVWGLLDMDSFLDQEAAVKHGYGVTANLFVRRELFEDAGGFDGSQPNSGDYEFVSRCVARGARLVYAEDAVVWHPTRNSARALLRKVWNVNRRYAEREAAAGRTPLDIKLRAWVPVVQTARGRVRAGKSLRLNRRRLEANDVRPSLRQELIALPVLYLLVPYLRCFAQLWGWRTGRHSR